MNHGAIAVESIGWVATAVFASSYLWKRPETLRRVQALAAVLWVVYGLVIHAIPVIVANLIVAGVATVSSLRQPGPMQASEEASAIRPQA